MIHGLLYRNCHHLISPAVSIGAEDGADFVSHPAEDIHDVFLTALGMGGVLEGPVVAIELTWESGAGLVGIATDCDDGLHLPREELIHVLAGVCADVYAYFRHGSDTEWMHIACGVRACAGDF